MDKIEFTTAEKEMLHYWRLHHPHPRVQRKMEALSLQSRGLPPAESCRLWGISPPTFSRYLRPSRTGGIEALKRVSFARRQSQLAAYRASMEADCRQHLLATVAEAATRLAALTGLQRGPPQGRQFFKT